MKTPIICARCGQEFDGGWWDEITKHKCVKPIRTNADRIRAMSDEELNFLILYIAEHKFDKIGFHDGQTVFHWLKQEVE